MLTIRPAQPAEFDAVLQFYNSLIDAMEGSPYHPRWVKGIYPAPQDLQAALNGGWLHVGCKEGEILCAMVLNHDCNEGYNGFEWPTKAAPNEVTVIHMLGVHPKVGRQGYGQKMVEYAIAAARANGQKALRLDVIDGNLPADRLYRRYGFVPLNTLNLFYEDTGLCAFTLYELAL